jgi:hypothetical protein
MLLEAERSLSNMYTPTRQCPSAGRREWATTSALDLIENPLVRLLILLLSFGRLFFLHGFCRLFLCPLFTVLTFAHDGSPFDIEK